MKLMKNAVPQTRAGSINADKIICFIHTLPPSLAYRPPPKYPLMGLVAAYTNIAVLNREPRLKEYKQLRSTICAKTVCCCYFYKYYLKNQCPIWESITNWESIMELTNVKKKKKLSKVYVRALCWYCYFSISALKQYLKQQLNIVTTALQL